MRTRTWKTRRNGEIEVSVLGFGGAPLGNMYRPVTETTADATLDAARAAGITYFDNAPLYGLGLSEERYGRAIARWGRDGIVLSTKIGRILDDVSIADVPDDPLFKEVPSRTIAYDYSYDGVMRSYEASRRRLRTDRIDILYIHDVDVWTHGSLEASDARIAEVMEGGYRALDELRACGAVKAIGTGVNEWEICERLVHLGDFDGFLLAGRYTLLEQGTIETFLPLCERRGIAVVLGGPYNSGILATGPVAGAKYNYVDAPPEIMERARRLQLVCRAHGVGLAEAALHFALAHPAIVSVIPGAVSPREVERNVAMLTAKIPQTLWADLKAEELVHADAPVPDGDFA